MNRIILFLGTIIIYFHSFAQTPFYYYQNKQIYLNENQLVRYIQVKQSVPIDQVQDFYAELSECCWRTDEFTPYFVKYYINQDKYPTFLQICNTYDSIISLHTPNYANNDTSIYYPERIVLAKINSNVDIQELLTENKVSFYNVVQSKYNNKEYCIYLTNDSALNYAAQLYETGYFEYSEPNFVGGITFLGYEDNPKFLNQWAVHNPTVNMNLLQAWEITTGHSNVKVAVIDSGVDLYHLDLKDNLLEGYDAVNDSQYPSVVCCGEFENNYDYHGTCCAGVIGAVNNEIGLVGVSHTSKIIPIRCGHTVRINIREEPNNPPTPHWVLMISSMWVSDALNHACYEDSADVINCSFAVYSPSSVILDKVTEICEQGRTGKGCIVVASAGNTDFDYSFPEWDTLSYLSNHPSVISVGSVTPCGERVKKGVYCEINSIYNSCYGDSLDVVAPGIRIPTTFIGPDYVDIFSGTSSAAPHVAGLAALVLSVNPCLTREEVKYVIESTCTKVRPDIYTYAQNNNHPNGTWNIEVGHGLVNAGSAVVLAQQMGGYSYVNDTLISNNTVWNINRLIGQDLVVDSMAILTISDTVYIVSSARIIVRPGGKLIVDGGTLTSACAGEMWQGIYVEGHRTQHQTAANQGTVQLLNGAVIENAHRGIYTGAFGENWHTTGGIITADSATFRNCAKAVEFLSYADTIVPGFINDNWSSFTNCTFTVDDNNLFAANNTNFLAHVTMWDVKGVRFTHCRFEDVRTGFHTRKSAISTIDAGFKIKNGCDYTLPLSNPDCNCYLTTNTYCSFSGFGTAINAATSGNPYAVSIDGARFVNNVTGVGISGNSHAEVTRCIFHLDSIIPDYRSVTGLSLSGCTGYLVEENTFTRVATSPSGNRYGIQVVASGTDMNSLYRNTFERLTRGITVSGINGDGDSHTGLQMSCNGFTNNTYDMYIASGATVCDNQGSTSKGADNTFSGTQTSSLYSAGSQSLTYHHSAGSSHAPYNPTTNYVTVNGTAGSNMCGSTICGYNPGNPGGGPKSPTPGFLSLKEQYDNLTADFNRNGYAEVLGHADVNTYDAATIAAAENAAQQISAIAAELYAQSHAAVRALMADTQEDIPAIWEWLNATPGLASRYLAVEAGFVAGADAVEAHGRASLQDIATQITASAERDEYDNYVAFQALKDALSYGNGHVAWPHATDAQVWELVRIADANTGRSSLLAKNVLCFFFGICYDDDMETRALTTTAIPPLAESTTLTGQQRITVHPNPTHDMLRVAVPEGDAGIARVEMFDMFGRAVSVETHGRASLPSPTLTVNTSAIPSGLYVLRVTLTDGAVRTTKVVKR